MTIQFTTEHGTKIAFASQASREAAELWYNNHSKGEIIAYCDSHGLNLHHPDGLDPDWADLAMQFYAQQVA